MADYRTITNYALRESGITQDDLTTANFASPPDPILTRFKNWVQQAYEDIQTDRRDWEFMQDSGVVLLQPKMELYGCVSPGTLANWAGAILRLHSTSNTPIITVGTMGTATDGTFLDNNVEAPISFSLYSDTPWLIEPGDLLTTSAGTVYGYFRRFGRYNLSQGDSSFSDYTADISEVKLDSVAISDYSYAAGQSYTSVTYSKLAFVPYGDWLRYAYDRPKYVGQPTHFTLSNNGQIEFYPPLDRAYHISFEYTRTPQTLSAHGDSPTYLPARFHNAIAWRAVMYWAEYEGNSQQYNRAKTRYTKFETEMIRDLLPPVKVSYDARQW